MDGETDFHVEWLLQLLQLMWVVLSLDHVLGMHEKLFA